MKYWRMQLHPDDAKSSSYYANESISKGFIGLGFATNVGDLISGDDKEILDKQKCYRVFANDMRKGDKVLIIAHHFPVALVTIHEEDGDYNYIRNTLPELGVWFNHFRKIDTNKTIYFADFQTNARSWEQLRMTNTISMLKDSNSNSYQLIEKMIEWGKQEYSV